MKKYLSILLALTMMIGTAACSQSSSDKKSSSEAEISYSTLDTVWECDYLKLSTCSNWDLSEPSDGVFDVTVYWEWNPKDSSYSNHISLYLNSDSYSKKLTKSELIEQFEDLKEMHLSEGRYEGESIENSFVKNGQAYIIISYGESDNREAWFQTDGLRGSIYYKAQNEEIVLEMIDSIEFY